MRAAILMHKKTGPKAGVCLAKGLTMATDLRSMEARPPGNASARERPVQHTSHDFDTEMRALLERLTAMAARCREQLHAALDAFWSGSKDKMADVEASDRAIDRDEKWVDASVLRILARRQPVAADLRFLTAAFKIVTDLERIGDEAVDLARTAFSGSPDEDATRGPLERMAEATEAMLEAALCAFFDSDGDAAERVRNTDDAIRTTYDEIFRDAIASMSSHPAVAASSLTLIAVAKCLERIADHAANIARWTGFVLGSSDMPSHSRSGAEWSLHRPTP
jgi:phosphate transport system protein